MHKAQTIDARRVRFESIDGLQRRDLSLAGEVWLRDICEARWATREAMNLAAHFVRYMTAADARQMLLSRIEHQVQLTRDEITFALRLMRLYRAIEAYSIDGEELRVALHLSTLQRLQVLEARHRLDYLTRHTAPDVLPPATGARWTPPTEPDDEGSASGESAAEPALR